MDSANEQNLKTFVHQSCLKILRKIRTVIKTGENVFAKASEKLFLGKCLVSFRTFLDNLKSAEKLGK